MSYRKIVTAFNRNGEYKSIVIESRADLNKILRLCDRSKAVVAVHIYNATKEVMMERSANKVMIESADGSEVAMIEKFASVTYTKEEDEDGDEQHDE